MKRIIVDVDGVIADKESGSDYVNAKPLSYGISQVNKLYDAGYHITLFTARYADRENGNIHMQYQRGYVELLNWLEKNKVKFHNLYMGKINGDLFIDDKAAKVENDSDEGWNQVWQEVKKLNKKDKYGRDLYK